MNKPLTLLITDDTDVVPWVEDVCELIEIVSPSPDDWLSKVDQFEPELVLCGLRGMDTAQFATLWFLAKRNLQAVVVFTLDDDRQQIVSGTEAGIAAYVIDTLDSPRLGAIVTAAVARFRQVSDLRTSLGKSRQQLAERKAIERAKGIIMNKKGVNEDAAYRLLRRTAMSCNKRIVEVAELILSSDGQLLPEH